MSDLNSESLTTLSQVLQTPDAFPWNEAIFLPEDQDWVLNSRVAVGSPDDSEEGDTPEIARNHGLTYALGVSAVQDIVANATEQKPNASLTDLLDAFLFYYEHDAFITFR